MIDSVIPPFFQGKYRRLLPFESERSSSGERSIQMPTLPLPSVPLFLNILLPSPTPSEAALDVSARALEDLTIEAAVSGRQRRAETIHPVVLNRLAERRSHRNRQMGKAYEQKTVVEREHVDSVDGGD